MSKFLRFCMFAVMLASVVGLVLGLLTMLFSTSAPNQIASMIMSFGAGVLTLGLFLLTGKGKSLPKEV